METTFKPSHGKSWYSLAQSASGEVEVYIYDEIGMFGVTPKQFITEASSFPSATGITVRVNSPGGDVFAGLAIYNYLMRQSVPVKCVVDGIAASIASAIVMAGRERLMPDNAMMFLHNPWTIVAGNSDDLVKEADALAKMQDALVGIYSTRSGQTPERVRELLDGETWLTAQEAAALGFATQVEPARQIAASFDPSLYRSIPSSVAGLYANREMPMPEAEKVEAPAPVVVDAAAVEAGVRAQFADMVSKYGAERASKWFAEGVSAADAAIRYDAEMKAAAEASVTAAPFAPPPEAPAKNESPKTWADALAKCGGDYPTARKQHRELYEKFMSETR